MRLFDELRLVPALTDDQIADMRDPRLVAIVELSTIEDAVKAGGFLAGRPEDINEGAEGGRETLSLARPRQLHHPARPPALQKQAQEQQRTTYLDGLAGEDLIGAKTQQEQPNWRPWAALAVAACAIGQFIVAIAK